MYTVYENYAFYGDFFLLLLLGFVFLFLATIGWNRMIADKDFRQKRFWLRILFLAGSITLFVLITPYARDIPAVQNKDYQLLTGELTDIWVSAHESLHTGPSYTTYFTIEEQTFHIDGNYKELEKLKHFNLTISYLLHTRNVVKIDISLMNEQPNRYIASF